MRHSTPWSVWTPSFHAGGLSPRRPRGGPRRQAGAPTILPHRAARRADGPPHGGQPRPAARVGRRLWLLACLVVCGGGLVAGTAAQAHTVVVGTGDPDIDVPAVQAAVDQGGDVILQGHFSFDRPPTIPLPFGVGQRAMIVVSQG